MGGRVLEQCAWGLELEHWHDKNCREMTQWELYLGSKTFLSLCNYVGHV